MRITNETAAAAAYAQALSGVQSYPSASGTGRARVQSGSFDQVDISQESSGESRFRKELAARLVQIAQDMETLITQFQPDEMSIEELFFSKNITTGIAVAHARGVILYTAERLHLPVYEYTPMQIKQAVVGYGLADKHQVMDMTRRLLKLRSIPRPDDAADALAIAMCRARSATSLLRKDPDVKETV